MLELGLVCLLAALRRPKTPPTTRLLGLWMSSSQVREYMANALSKLA